MRIALKGSDLLGSSTRFRKLLLQCQWSLKLRLIYILLIVTNNSTVSWHISNEHPVCDSRFPHQSTISYASTFLMTHLSTIANKTDPSLII